MPYIERAGVRLHYEVTGPKTGEPIVLVMGLGMDMSGWDEMLPYLEGFRVLRIDNRGAGLSDAPNRPYSIPGMARDVIAVMDAARMETAHIYGASLGSMIAQEIALSHRDRVRTLILGCPSPGVVSVPGSLRMLTLLLTRTRYTPEEAFARAAPFLFHTALEDPDALKRALLQRQTAPFQPVGFRRQLEAVLRWSSLRRLPSLRVPTLVIHGDHDRLIPTINGRLIARLIRGAKLHIVKGAGHVYSVDAPGEAAREVVGFLRQYA
jgi:pimeloyl-ACP methyl ester carboxylesterase